MTDTAQPFVAAETDHDPIETGADAFKAFLGQGQPRDEQGRFAGQQEAAAEEEAEPEAVEAEGDAEPEEIEDEQEAAEEAQPMPPSWPEAEAEQWASLPPETQAFLAKREGEREAALTAKFQESANARKEALAEQQVAATNRQKYADLIETMSSVLQPMKPDPRAFGAGTGQYNREAYDLALAEYEQQAGVLAQLQEQRDALRQEAETEEARQFEAWKQSLEAEWAPKFVADVPELRDPSKAETAMRAIVDYGVRNGLPAETFDPENQGRITSPELHLLWKAMKFDELRSKGAQVQPKPKPASPAVKPGVSSTRSAQRNVQRVKAWDRLSSEGSVEAGAAVFKQLLR